MTRAGQCAVCAHPSVLEIDHQLLNGVPMTALEKKYSVSDSAILRHRDRGHIASTAVAMREAFQLSHSEAVTAKITEYLRACEEIVSKVKPDQSQETISNADLVKWGKANEV